ncbi:Ger(x)C family spore germination protein [Paenibacillus sp. HN-1]|uniref:Ger(x)C family spore germination protein n=1 Tax=Paenibacillus TaxID=44249 RepID=UPI001CA8C933|nr:MULTISPECIES: Ger(x)C family spore germination protein [Paenibacillus]MBY9077938.1 Ger(x)C family spore germination protein [Paenibacillus sp. CGMCC 1.18879]MBY9084640.1 Ger(x)C family spore germination protein [Paenibacillus sinensis]
MRRWIAVTLSIALVLPVSGCWDKTELTEFGYVQAVALDKGEQGEIVLTTHFYNPSNAEGMGGETKKTSAKGISIRTEANTIFEAIRDIPVRYGRKAKWDHMRVILIGEELARDEDIREVLDFFSRDQEPRPTVPVMIAGGNAGDLFKIKPFVESTIGQQLQELQRSGAKFTAKTSNVPFFDLALQFMSETDVEMVPYVKETGPSKVITASGIAVLKNGKLARVVSPADTESLMMLLNKYENGIIEFPCPDSSEESKRRTEAFEVMSLKTKVKTVTKDERAIVQISTQIIGSLGEISCTSIKTEQDEKRLEDHIQKFVEDRMQKVMNTFQEGKLDVIGAGNQVYRKNPRLWKRWKPTWDKRFAASQVDIHVEVNISDSGIKTTTPFGKKEE